jgi:RNase adapter protein RapZ
MDRMSGTTRLLLLSGLSGSGKSVALHLLEDLGFYCIDNIPAAMLKPFIAHTVQSGEAVYLRTAVGIDARNTDTELNSVPQLVDELRRSGIDCELIFLVANDDELLRRFAETRRAHPLSRHGESLREAIAMERRLLEPVINAADLVIDTSRMGVHELREQVHQRVEQRSSARLAVLLESFGFKHGIPGDADFVFDARSLPNPYWDSALRALNGKDAAVVRFLESHTRVSSYVDDIVTFIAPRFDEFRASNRRYLTVAVGCTGGQHRSVYIVEQLQKRFAGQKLELRVRHSGLNEAATGR